ncbi:MAG: HAMP domain-containing histidine kinase [Synechococcales cyanobacterium CRU_2_2]|nr:HAMP domain-containing histidine kinase [Synechococcales cyanobacterium CRU_2_2]
MTFAVLHLYSLVLHPQSDQNDALMTVMGGSSFDELYERFTIVSDWVSIFLIFLCLILQRTRWGRRHPGAIFLALSWSITLSVQILGTLMGLPLPGSWDFIFLAQVIVVPVNWRLHLFSQLPSVFYHFVMNPILGPSAFPALADLWGFEAVLAVTWTCLICNVAVYFYDRVQQRDFESRRELKLFLHAVTHDLRTPVIGTSIVLKNLLRKAENDNSQAVMGIPKLEQLLAGNDRQLQLINSILEAHSSEIQPLDLDLKPLNLSLFSDAVLLDLEALLDQNKASVTNHIVPNLPLVLADLNQLWRVFSNLIVNAVTHNCSGIKLTLDAELKGYKTVYCTIQDSGMGIPIQQQRCLFELYYRGPHSRYSTGLGMGLYLCRKIIMAHGGQIGVISQPHAGSTFWFTLPLTTKC